MLECISSCADLISLNTLQDEMVQWLCVAEKPSIAKAITQILSGGNFQTVSRTGLRSGSLRLVLR